MAECKRCGESGLSWKREGDRWKLTDKSGEYHVCKVFEVPLYVNINGVLCNNREETLAKMCVDLCIQQGLDPYSTEFVRVGDVLRPVRKPVVVQR